MQPKLEELYLASLAIILIITACMGPAGPHGELVLEGPVHYQVDKLGRVDGPVAIVEGLEEGELVEMTVEPATVAHIRDGELHAVGPGEATVRASWKEQTIEWTLVVEPALTLEWVEPPAAIAVGQTHAFVLSAHTGDVPAEVGKLSWTSSNPAIATVSSTGDVTGVAAGVVYVTATAARSEAMIELTITP